jgi:hypothetical protein
VNIHGLTWANLAGDDVKIAAGRLWYNLAGSAFYLGLFVLPLIFGAVFSKKKKENTGIRGKSVIFAFSIIMAVFCLSKGSMPYFENVISRYGLGTITVHHAASKAAGIFASPLVWNALTLLGAVSFLYLLYGLIKNPGMNKEAKVVILTFALQFAVAAARHKFFDRYILLLLPAGITASLAGISRRRYNIYPAAAAVFLMALCSYTGARDYMRWNRAKYSLAGSLTHNGFAKNEIANGFDWDGWNTYEDNMKKLLENKRAREISEWEWMSMNPYRVMVSFSPRYPEAELIARIGYKTPLSGKEEYLYAWKIK